MCYELLVPVHHTTWFCVPGDHNLNILYVVHAITLLFIRTQWERRSSSLQWTPRFYWGTQLHCSVKCPAIQLFLLTSRGSTTTSEYRRFSYTTAYVCCRLFFWMENVLPRGSAMGGNCESWCYDLVYTRQILIITVNNNTFNIRAKTCCEFRSYLIKYFVNCCEKEGTRNRMQNPKIKILITLKL
jgi:hypothetical protein